ncbi:ACP S-malonyltransferase [Desulfobacterales bacterium HSG2]|nr:ACP S-malonyltransferase [Desulfobacterales bacterium HSG2]
MQNRYISGKSGKALPVVFMFSGQGSQYYNMGGELFEKNDLFQREMRLLDALAADLLGESVLDRIYDRNRRKRDTFDRLLYTHPALFMQQYALARTLSETGIKPDFVMGTSMGEFVSAAVAGILSSEDALRAVIRQAEDLEEYCPRGGMLAVLHNPELYDRTPLLRENSEMAGVNFDSHFVVSGTPEGLQRISDFLREKAIAYLLLPLTVATHSSFIDRASPSYRAFLRQLSFNMPEIPFISCSRASLLKEIPSDYLWEVAREPIRFQESIRNSETRGSHIWLDLGPSGTLANFVSYNLDKGSDSVYMSILTPFGNDRASFEKVKKYFSEQPVPVRGHIQMKGNTMKAYIFPGQGSQKKGMGDSLFDEFPQETAKADQVLGYSIKELCLKDPDNFLGQTDHTQPALYTVNALMWMRHTADKDGDPPDFMAGHSLGEYNALFAAGAFDFETGLRLVKERGRLMAMARGGAMAAVVGLGEEKIQDILRENNFITLSVANYNSPLQIVISGPAEDIEKAEPVFKAAGAKHYLRLKVSAAFHSPYMKEAAEEFARFTEEFTFEVPHIPVISNVTAQPHGKDVKDLLVAQITSPVQWTGTIRYLTEQGVTDFKELGPGNVLTGLLRRIRTEEPETRKAEEKPPAASPQIQPTTDNQPQTKDNRQPTTDNRQPTTDNRQPTNGKITAENMGSRAFREEYNLKYAYLTGAMFRGIASKELVIAMGKAGMMGYLGTGGMELNAIEDAIRDIQSGLDGKPCGMNLLHNYYDPDAEEKLVDLYLKHGIKYVEAAAYMQMTPALVRYRLTGLAREKDGRITSSHKVMGKISRPEVAEAFLSPAPERIVNKLLEGGKITREQADLSRNMPMADAICAEADSGGHTDGASAYALFPAVHRLRDDMMRKYGYEKQIFIGAAGGIGTPGSAAAAFILGADFILTGSINQCTVEAGTSDLVKDMLQEMNVQDTDYAPAGDMFETGAKVQLLRKGVFFPARANKLYDLYRQYDSVHDIDEKTKKQLQEKYFKRSFDEIWEETKSFFSERDPEQIKKAEKSPKHKMALIFRWYFGHTTRIANEGIEAEKVNFQVHTGPALGAFNQWVKGTGLENWRNRHVDKIAEKLMRETADLLNRRFAEMGTDPESGT